MYGTAVMQYQISRLTDLKAMSSFTIDDIAAN
jgi:hypothetical protein